MATNPITLEMLEVLDSIDRRGSFANAAEELNKATSAISYSIQKLEDQLELSIFVRQGRRSVLTAAGRAVLEDGRIILEASSRLADRAKEIASGWEPRLLIGIESIVNQRVFFNVLAAFQDSHPNLQIDVRETVLNGGWESLELDNVNLLVGATGPVPKHKGFRTVSIGRCDLVPVISADHPAAEDIRKSGDFGFDYSALRTIVSHDTAVTHVARSAGLSMNSSKVLYVQNVDQKVEAILAGLGIGHLPRYRIHRYVLERQLIELPIALTNPDCFLAWKISNKGKALKSLSSALASVDYSLVSQVSASSIE